MTTDLQTTDFRQTFRSVAAARFHSAADMPLHQLVDEFQALSAVVAANTVTEKDDGFVHRVFNDAAKVALRERNVVNGAAKARFGIAFNTYDSGENDVGGGDSAG